MVMKKTNKILLIEDDPSNRRLLGYILKSEGFEVVSCSDGQEALQDFEESPADLVILDLMMPNMDGIEFCRTLRSLHKTQKIPVIVLTAKDQTEDRYEAFKVGADDYLTKPFDPVELLYRVRAFLRLTSRESLQMAEVLEVGAVKLEPGKYMAEVDGIEVRMTKMETMILYHLMTHVGEVYSAEFLARHVIETSKAKGCTDDAIHAHIRNIRLKIEQDPKEPTIIVTVGRKGYAFAG